MVTAQPPVHVGVGGPPPPVLGHANALETGSATTVKATTRPTVPSKLNNRSFIPKSPIQNNKFVYGLNDSDEPKPLR